MNDVLLEAGKQIPALVVLVWIVHTFLNFLNKMAERNSESMTKLSTALDSLRETILKKR